MDDAGQLRSSDADREGVVQELRAHYAAERISEDELSDRLAAVYAAPTAGELARLGEDLPVLHPVVAADPGRELRRRRLLDPSPSGRGGTGRRRHRRSW